MDYNHEFTVGKMCSVLEVSTSGYYKWRKRRADQKALDKDLRERIRYEFEQSRCTYGSPRIAAALNKDSYTCSKSTVARYMDKIGIKARKKKKFRLTTNSNHAYKPFENVLNREFTVDKPGKVWVGDITYIKVAHYWVYLSVVIDLADRMVVGWSLSKDLGANNTVIQAFRNACKLRQPVAGFIFHSDRGVQYACDDFTSLIKKTQGIQSMSRKGNCWDNAVAESFFKTLKVECIYRIKIHNIKHAASIIFDYIDGWYNTKRRHSALKGLSPIDAFIEKSKYLAQAA